MRVKSTVHVNDLSIALHCLLDLITNINGSKILPDLDLAFFLAFLETRAAKKQQHFVLNNQTITRKYSQNEILKL